MFAPYSTCVCSGLYASAYASYVVCMYACSTQEIMSTSVVLTIKQRAPQLVR